MTPVAPADLARAAEERGFSALYAPEHAHIPTSRRDQPEIVVTVLDAHAKLV